MEYCTEKHRAANRAEYKKRTLSGICCGCGSRDPKRKPQKGRRLCNVCLKRKRAYYYRDRETRKDANKDYRRRLREEVYAHYGGFICACCKEGNEEFLTIDHADGDGAEHRREIGRATYAMLLWLKRNNYPRGFRILCMNCNFSLGMRGYCPHSKRKSRRTK